MELTHLELLNQLYYSIVSGKFYWKIAKGRHKFPIKRPAGNHNKIINAVQIRVNTKLYLAHRLAWFYLTGTWPKEQIDHVNRDRSHNQWINLRESNNGKNGFNKLKNRNNKSGYKGVCWCNTFNKWVVRSVVDGKAYFLGYFAKEDLLLAAKAYDDFVKEKHGEFYCAPESK